MPKEIVINGDRIGLGEDRQIHLNIARLPTYTSIDLPVRVIRAEKDGPVLLLSGGLHGDEINGIEIVRRLIANDHLKLTAGTIIAIPLMNIYGFIQNVRGVPDGKDINRSFPGNKSGSLATLVAYTLMNEIIPQIDYGIDFHTGGASRANYPQIRCVFDIEKNMELAKAFSAPVTLNSSLIEKSFRKASHKKGKHILVYETGESLRLDEHGINEGIVGTKRLMHYLGMRRKPTEDHPATTNFYKNSKWVRAKYAGIFNSTIELGEIIKKRQLLGKITDPFGNESYRVICQHEGQVIGLNNSPVVHKGDALLHIATN